MLGFGTRHVVRVAADDQGRMRPDALAAALDRAAGSVIVCAQAGNVNTGAFDPFDAIADAAAERGAWLHVDGAFGLWAGGERTAAPSRARRRARRLVGDRRAQVAQRPLRLRPRRSSRIPPRTAPR